MKMFLSHRTPQKHNNDHPKCFNLWVFLHFLCACKLLCTDRHCLVPSPSELPTKSWRESSAISALQLTRRFSGVGSAVACSTKQPEQVVAFVTLSVAHLFQHCPMPAGLKSCFLSYIFRWDRQCYVADFQDCILFKDPHMMNKHRFLSLESQL